MIIKQIKAAFGTVLAVSCFLLLFNNSATALQRAEIDEQIKQGQYKQALAQINEALAGDKDSLSLQVMRADVIAAEGKPDEAIKIYRGLIKQHPQQAELYNNLAILLSNNGEHQAARDMLNEGLRTNKTYATIYENLSSIYMEMARDSYGKALQLGVKLAPLPLKPLAVVDDSPVVVAANKVVTNKAETVNKELKNIVKLRTTSETKVTAEAVNISTKQQDVIDSLQAWAAAWSAQAVDLYLSFYHREYKPARGVSRAKWEAQRKSRLKKPKWIQIELDDIKVELNSENRAKVILIQSYKSSTYQDKTRKQVSLAETSNGWRILKERSLGAVQ